jgi:hypothetical protein
MKTTKTNGAASRAAKTTTTTPAINYKTSCALIRLTATRDKFVDRCRELHSQGVDIATEIERMGISAGAIPRRVNVMIAEQRAERATVKCEIELPAWVYGYLCTAAAVRGHADYKAALFEYLERTVLDWSNQGYYLQY